MDNKLFIKSIKNQIKSAKRDLMDAQLALKEHYANWDSAEWYVGHNYNHYGFDYHTRLYEQDIEELQDILCSLRDKLNKALQGEKVS